MILSSVKLTCLYAKYCGDRNKQKPMTSKLSWTAQEVPGQYGLHSKVMSQTKQANKQTQQMKKQILMQHIKLRRKRTSMILQNLKSCNNQMPLDT